MLSQIFCCSECHDSVAIVEQFGGDLTYECTNPACGKVVSIDCPEALALVENVTLKLPTREVEFNRLAFEGPAHGGTA